MNSEQLERLRSQLHPDVPRHSVSVLREEHDWGHSVVVFGDPREGWYDWALLDEDGNVEAQSTANYGSPSSALRDGLLYAECGQVLRGGNKKDDPYRLGLHDWIVVKGENVKVSASIKGDYLEGA